MAARKQTSKQASIHMHVRNAVTLVWGSLRLTPIRLSSLFKNSSAFWYPVKPTSKTLSASSVSWCLTVSHCVSWCLTVSHGVSWCLTVSHGVSWCLTVSHGVSWCLTVSHGVSWCLTVSHGVSWCLTVSHGV